MSNEGLHFDFETRSTSPFGKAKDAVTAIQYAKNPDTDVWCMSWAICDEPVLLWDPWEGEDFPDEFLYALKQRMTAKAHNAGFEWAIWNFLLVPRMGLPKLPIEQMDCTAARAAIMALPRALEGACAALALPFQKDKEGHALMQRMAKPRKPRKGEDPTVLYWWDDEDRRTRLGNYCLADTEAERGLDQVLKPMGPMQREMWLRVHRTNVRGVCVDVEFATKAKRVMEVVAQSYCDRISEATGGAVTSPTGVPAMKAWLTTRGVDADSLDKTSVIHLLEKHADDAAVCELLTLRQAAGKSSVAKLDRFITLTGEQQRMLENFLFHAANTGRLGGKGAQLQNLPSRGGLKWYDAEACIRIILETPDPEWASVRIELLYGEVPTALSSCLRGCIMAPPGKKLFVADFSNIEGRVAAWLGDEQWKLRAFREYDTPLLDENGNRIPCPDDGFKRKGPDLYKVTAGSILGKSPTAVVKTERNVLGKVPELALGFGGGVGAFDSMAKIYNVDMSEHWPVIQKALDPKFIDKAFDNWDRFGMSSGTFQDTWLASEAVKLAWRARHPGIVKCWYDAEDCAKEALRNPGKWFKFAGDRCAFGAQSIGGKMFLISRLPNGRRLYRCDARLTPIKKFNKASEEIRFMGVDSVTRQWVRMSTYGGDLFQSFVQAIAYDLMDHGWANVEAKGFDVVLSVHDEIGAEADVSRDLQEFIDAMNDTPQWAAGCPVSSAGYVAERYRKD